MGDRLEEAYEGIANRSLRVAIEQGAMRPIAGVQGEEFRATGCQPHGEVRFCFERAMVGVYLSAFGAQQIGVYVSISATLHDCGDHPRARIVQVCREIVRAGDDMVSARPRDDVRAQRSGYGHDDALSLGWRVDQAHGHDSVYWTDGGRRDGRDGSSNTPLRLLDAPASLPDGDGHGATRVGKEFRACVTSEGTVLASVAWGYYIDEHGVVGMYPERPVARAGAGPEVFDAIVRWDDTPGHAPSGITKP